MDTGNNMNGHLGKRGCEGQLSIPVALGWLSLGMLAAFPLFAVWKFQQHGAQGIVAVVVAFLLCFFSAGLAILVTGRGISGGNAGTGLLFSMLFAHRSPAVRRLPARKFSQSPGIRWNSRAGDAVLSRRIDPGDHDFSLHDQASSWCKGLASHVLPDPAHQRLLLL